MLRDHIGLWASNSQCGQRGLPAGGWSGAFHRTWFLVLGQCVWPGPCSMLPLPCSNLWFWDHGLQDWVLAPPPLVGEGGGLRGDSTSLPAPYGGDRGVGGLPDRANQQRPSFPRALVGSIQEISLHQKIKVLGRFFGHFDATPGGLGWHRTAGVVSVHFCRGRRPIMGARTRPRPRGRRRRLGTHCRRQEGDTTQEEERRGRKAGERDSKILRGKPDSLRVGKGCDSTPEGVLPHWAHRCDAACIGDSSLHDMWVQPGPLPVVNEPNEV